MWQRIKNVAKRASELDLKSLGYIKFGMFGVIVVDIFLIWWYLNLKTLASGLLVFSMLILALVLFLERQKDVGDFNTIRKSAQTYFEDKLNNQKGGVKMETAQEVKPEPVKEEKKEEPKEDKEQEDKEDDSMGLPSPEEYQKRMEDAFGVL